MSFAAKMYAAKNGILTNIVISDPPIVMVTKEKANDRKKAWVVFLLELNTKYFCNMKLTIIPINAAEISA